ANTSGRAYTSAKGRIVRARVLLPCVAAVLTACTRLPSTPPGTTLPAFSIRPVDSATPSPFVQIQSGSVRAIVPGSWPAAPLPTRRLRGLGDRHVPCRRRRHPMGLRGRGARLRPDPAGRHPDVGSLRGDRGGRLRSAVEGDAPGDDRRGAVREHLDQSDRPNG